MLCALGTGFWILLALKLTSRTEWNRGVVVAPAIADIAIAAVWAAIQLMRAEGTKPNEERRLASRGDELTTRPLWTAERSPFLPENRDTPLCYHLAARTADAAGSLVHLWPNGHEHRESAWPRELSGQKAKGSSKRAGQGAAGKYNRGRRMGIRHERGGV